MYKCLATLLFLMGWGAVCVPGQDGSSDVVEMDRRPVFHVDVVERITAAVNYRHRSGSTRIDFRGTQLMPKAEGTAKVESKQGYIEISAKFDKLAPPLTFGTEYLTYVLWAITPEGRAANLGEVLLKDGDSKLNVTTELQVFGLVVTAEPYFAVRQPSDLVVLENEVRPDTKGQFDVIDAKYELLRRGQYRALSNPLSLTVNPDVPLELYEARNAIEIARSSGAGQYAEDIFLRAERSLQQAEAYQARKAGDKPVAMLAREAVQRAEDAREVAIRRYEQAQLRQEREEAAQREAAARAEAEAEAKRRAEAERQQLERAEAAQRARDRADQESAARRRLEEELEKARQAAEQAQAAAERTMDLLKERTASFGEERARWEEERTRREQEEAERTRRLRELEQAETRVRIYSQLSRVLFTRDSDDGLVLEIPPELFGRGAAELTTEGREKLSMVAGILLAHPGLSLSARAAEITPAAVKDHPLEAARTEAVRSYMLDRGLVADRLWEGQSITLNPEGDAVDTELPLAGDPITLVVSGAPIEAPGQLETIDRQ